MVPQEYPHESSHWREHEQALDDGDLSHAEECLLKWIEEYRRPYPSDYDYMALGVWHGQGGFLGLAKAAASRVRLDEALRYWHRAEDVFPVRFRFAPSDFAQGWIQLMNHLEYALQFDCEHDQVIMKQRKWPEVYQCIAHCCAQAEKLLMAQEAEDKRWAQRETGAATERRIKPDEDTTVLWRNFTWTCREFCKSSSLTISPESTAVAALCLEVSLRHDTTPEARRENGEACMFLSIAYRRLTRKDKYEKAKQDLVHLGELWRQKAHDLGFWEDVDDDWLF